MTQSITLVEELVEETRGLLTEARLVRLRANRNIRKIRDDNLWRGQYDSAADFRKKEVPEDCGYCFGEVDNSYRSFGNMKATCSTRCRELVREIQKANTAEKYVCGQCRGYKGNRDATTGLCRPCWYAYKRTSAASRQKQIQRRIGNNLRSKLHSSLKEASSKKNKRTFEYLGCSFQELQAYLESKFTEGMTWENWSYHGWHIDHIRPISSFDLMNEEEKHLCFHYTNLQPLWAKDNLKKSSKYNP